MRILDAVRCASEYLEKAGIDDSLADAEIITYHAAGTDRMTAFIENAEISRRTFSRIMRMAGRRAKGEPVQYIVGHVDFLGLTLSVGPGVLIPRPETELLAEEAIKAVRSKESGSSSPLAPHSLLPVPSLSFLDLCTGSGCIALALAKEFPGAKVTATDISEKALSYARKNARANAIRNVSFRKGSLFGPVKKGTLFDLIVSNPPYVTRGEIPGLQREVRDWEPLCALDGGEDGLGFYREILGRAGGYLKPGGVVLMEMGYGQAGPLAAISKKNGFLLADVIKDLCGIGRIIHLKPLV